MRLGGKLGLWGENFACVYLRGKGYQILARNYHSRYGEIDIVARKGEELYFVEVKTRRFCAYAWPEEAVNYFKLRKIYRTARVYLDDFKIKLLWQVVVLAIEADPVNKRARIKLVKPE